MDTQHAAAESAASESEKHDSLHWLTIGRIQTATSKRLRGFLCDGVCRSTSASLSSNVSFRCNVVTHCRNAPSHFVIFCGCGDDQSESLCGHKVWRLQAYKHRSVLRTHCKMQAENRGVQLQCVQCNDFPALIWRAKQRAICLRQSGTAHATTSAQK